MTALRPPAAWRVVALLCRRDLARFVRQPARIAAAVGTPALLWVFLGSGVGDAFRPAGAEAAPYAAYVAPGMILLVAVFGAIFSSISVIDDRNEGSLPAILVSPAPRFAIALGRALGGALTSWIPALLLLPAVPMAGLHPGAIGWAVAILALALASLGAAGLGLAFAWRCATSASFHAVMNLVFMPMWLLSGAFFPADRAAAWLAWPMRLDPLTWCTDAVRSALEGAPSWIALGGAGLFAVATLAAATIVVARDPA